jgi:hypothetical protein
VIDDALVTLVMKTAIQLIIAGLLTGAVHAEFRTWTREDGKTAELELTAATGEAAAKTGKFKMHNGRTINLPASSLVDFYEKNKDARFELVLITSDSDEGAMENYAAEFKMPWPQLKLSKVSGFKKDHPYPGTGIPNLVLTDLDCKLIKGSYGGTTYHRPTVVMNHLATLLKK